MNLTISIIAAISDNRALGKNNKLLWQIPEDLKRFKKLTMGHPVIMGRKTFESIGKPLPQRTNIVVTSNPNYHYHPPDKWDSLTPALPAGRPRDLYVVNSLEDAIKLAKRCDRQEIFIIGGGQIYSQALKYADKLYLTVVKGNFAADTFFPDYFQFSKVISKKKSQDADYHYTFWELER